MIEKHLWIITLISQKLLNPSKITLPFLLNHSQVLYDPSFGLEEVTIVARLGCDTTEKRKKK